MPADDDAASVLRGKGAIGRRALELFNRVVAARDAEEAIADARAKWDASCCNKWVQLVLRAAAAAAAAAGASPLCTTMASMASSFVAALHVYYCGMVLAELLPGLSDHYQELLIFVLWII